MFEDLKKAWREAVDNFRQELAGDDEGADSRTRAMHKELMTARSVLEKLDGEIRRSRREAADERESEAVCRRREEMARKIGDEETVRIAVEFCARHAERAGVLERKAEVLQEERSLLVRDLESMEKTIAERPDAPRVTASGTDSPRDAFEDQSDRDYRDFGELEREARERAVDERLEELKRKMR